MNPQYLPPQSFNTHGMPPPQNNFQDFQNVPLNSASPKPGPHIPGGQQNTGPQQGMPPPQGGGVRLHQGGFQQSGMIPPQGSMGPQQGGMGPPQASMGTPQGSIGPPQGIMGPTKSGFGQPPQNDLGAGMRLPPSGALGPPRGAAPGQGGIVNSHPGPISQPPSNLTGGPANHVRPPPSSTPSFINNASNLQVNAGQQNHQFSSQLGNSSVPPATNSPAPHGDNSANSLPPSERRPPPNQTPTSQGQIPQDQRPPSQSNSFGGPPTSNSSSKQLSGPLQNGSPSIATDQFSPQKSAFTPISSQQNLPSSVLPPQRQLPPTSRPNVNSPPNMLPGPPLPGQNLPSRPGVPQGQPLHGQQQFSMPGQPPLPAQFSHAQPPLPGQPPLPSQYPSGQSLPGQSFPGQPPVPGQQSFPGRPPLPGQSLPRQPPLPGQQPLPTHPMQYPGQQQFNQPPPMGQQGGYTTGTGVQPNQMPPLPGQYTQLSNQMQGMNLGGPRQYPPMPQSKGPGPMDSSLPHMPPPLNQQQAYMNGPQQQLRGPQGPYPPGPGQAPMGPGQTPMGPGGAYPAQGYQQQQQPQQKRLDPDQMPSPIQVMQDDQQNRSGVFVTNQKGLVPPLVTTNFVVQDQGNASPRYIRSTMYNVPISQDIMKQTAVPFSLVISPMARTVDQEFPPPIVNFGELGPVRCIRCKAYMCPYMQFIDSGRRFQCLFCKATTDVPTEYFQHLDHTGQRMDRFERPELVLGTYEFVATADYCRNNVLPKPPAVIFVIDVSYNNIKSGLVHLLCSQMKEIIKHLPIDQGQERSNMRVGFITYNSSVHFYNIKGTLAAPQMMVVGDTQEMFMPLLDGFLCTPEESECVIDSLMEQIPAMFGDTKETETVLLPAILAGVEALKASECAGKLVVFHSSLPTAEAPGKLKNRDDRKVLGTDKEKTVLTPQTQAYNQLGQDCVGVGCSVDLFLFNNSFIDVATIGQVSRLSGGEVFKYTYFQADIDGERLISDIIMDISRPIAFDGIMRVRTSTGIRPTEFYGHFFMSNTTDMELGAIDCDKGVAVEIKHDDKLSEEEGVYIQAALLYTSCSGQRRLRIINLSLKSCSQMADLYRSCDLDTIINYIAKQSVYKLSDISPKAVKDAIVTRAAHMLATYRKNCASPSSAGQLILPECMKLLPLYVNCLLKSDALSGGSDMTIDDRAFIMQTVMIMDIPTSVHHFYPRLIPLHDLDPTKDPIEIPSPIRCTVEKMNEQGVYILENGIHMFLWVGLGVDLHFVQNVFGAPSAIQIDIERVALPELDNPLSIAVRNIIEEVRIQRHRCMRLTLVRQREKIEPVFKHFLVEDRGTDGSASYVDFLCHMHKEIRSLLS